MTNLFFEVNALVKRTFGGKMSFFQSGRGKGGFVDCGFRFARIVVCTVDKQRIYFWICQILDRDRKNEYEKSMVRIESRNSIKRKRRVPNAKKSFVQQWQLLISIQYNLS